MESHPYDPNQLQQLINHIRDNGPVISSPEPPNETIIHEPGFEGYPGAVTESVAAVKGLFRVFTEKGREARQAEAQRHIEVAQYVGDRLVNPRQTGNPKEKIGWVGYLKEEVVDRSLPAGTYEGDFTHMGEWLMRKTHDGPRTVPNTLRPSSRKEHKTARKINDLIDERNELSQEARAISMDYGSSITNANIPRTRKERKAARKAVNRISKLEQKAEKSTEELAKVASSYDRRGKRIRRRAR